MRQDLPDSRWEAAALRLGGINPYPSTSRRDHTLESVLRENPAQAAVAGRVVRVERDAQGASAALTLRDETAQGRFPFIGRGAGAPERAPEIVAIAVGDIVECLLIRQSDRLGVQHLRLLTRSLRSWQQMVLAGEPLVRWAAGTPQHQQMRRRSRILGSVRRFFEERDFLEVETPILVPYPDVTPHLASFPTCFRDEAGGSRALYLHTSPELCMKQLLAAGYEKIFQVVRFFRNGESTPLHNPEFTGLEWYQAYTDYQTIMDQVEELICRLAEQHCGGLRLAYQGKAIDLSPAWERKTLGSLVWERTGVDLCATPDPADLARELDRLGVRRGQEESWEDLFYRLFVSRIEPGLGVSRPLFLTEFPAPLASLAKLKPGDPRVAERFEMYAGGLELANGFTELNDPAEQRRRFETEAAVKQPRAPYPLRVDEAFLRALEHGMPPAGGVALGLDRVVMLLTDAASIEEVLFFPFSLWPPSASRTVEANAALDAHILPNPPCQGPGETR